MYKPVVRILLKLFELIGCLACLITKKLTDQEARRIALRNQKFSREWSLLNNVTWSREGNTFADVAFGGYSLITGIFLISRLIDAKSRPTVTDKTFLVIGVLFFFLLGGLVYASIEQIPPDLFDNAIILGTLSFFVGALFLIDLADSSKRPVSQECQTDATISNQTSATQTSTQQEEIVSELKRRSIQDLQPYTSISKPSNSSHHATTTATTAEYQNGSKNGFLTCKSSSSSRSKAFDEVQSKKIAERQQPVIVKIMPAKSKLKKFLSKNNHNNYHNFDIDTSAYNHPSGSKNYWQNPGSSYWQNDFNTSEEENLDHALKPGFVAQRARMWDEKVTTGSDERNIHHERFTQV